MKKLKFDKFSVKDYSHLLDIEKLQLFSEGADFEDPKDEFLVLCGSFYTVIQPPTFMNLHFPIYNIEYMDALAKRLTIRKKPHEIKESLYYCLKDNYLFKEIRSLNLEHTNINFDFLNQVISEKDSKLLFSYSGLLTSIIFSSNQITSQYLGGYDIYNQILDINNQSKDEDFHKNYFTKTLSQLKYEKTFEKISYTEYLKICEIEKKNPKFILEYFSNLNYHSAIHNYKVDNRLSSQFESSLEMLKFSKNLFLTEKTYNNIISIIVLYGNDPTEKIKNYEIEIIINNIPHEYLNKKFVSFSTYNAPSLCALHPDILAAYRERELAEKMKLSKNSDKPKLFNKKI